MGRQLLRCGHFDKTGRARGAFGCVFGGCEFVHPDSPDWAVARPSRRRFHYYDYSKDDDDDMEVGKEEDGQRGVKKRGKGKGKGGNPKGERLERSRAFSPPRPPAYSASRSRSRSRSGAREEWRAYSRGRDHGRSWSPGRRTRERGRSPSFSPRRRSRSRSDFRRDASPPSRARGRGRSRSWTRSRSRSRFKSPPLPTGTLYAPPPHSMVGRSRKKLSETSGAAKNRRRQAREGRDGDGPVDEFVYSGHGDRTRSWSRSRKRRSRRDSRSRSRSRDTDIGSSRSASPTSPNTSATGKGKGKARAKDTSINSSSHNAFRNLHTDKNFIRDATSTTPTTAHTPLSTFFPPSSKRALTHPPPPTPPSKRASMSELLPLPGPPSPSSRRNPPQPSEPPPPSPPKGPAPLVPRFLLSKTLQNQRVNLVLSAEEKKRQEKLWDDRIKLFSTCAQASENLHTAREDLRAASGLANSSFFGFSEAKKAQIEKQYASLQARVDEQGSAFQDMKAGVVRFEAAVSAPSFSGATPGGTPGGTPGPTPTPTPTTTTTFTAASLSTSTSTLASSGLPPSHRKSASLPPSRAELATGDLQQYKDTSAQLDALLQNVGRMRSVLQEVRDARARVARLEMEREEEERAQEQERLNRDAKAESLATVSGTRKRRDLGDESDATEEDTAAPEEVQRMRGLLAKYARTTAEVQSDLIHQRNDFLDIASGVLDAKVETLRDQRKVSADAKQRQHEKERVKLKAEARTTLDDIKETQSGLDEQLAEVSGTLVGLLQQTAQIEEDVEEEKKQAVGTRSRVEQIRERMQAMKRAQETQNASLASLRADIDAAIQQTPVVDSSGRATLMPHPVTGIVEHPVVPEILQSLQPTLDEAVRRRIDETREAVKGTIDKGNAELYKRFWELTAPARAVLAVVEKVAGNLAIQPATTSSEPGHPLPQALSGDPQASRPSSAAPRPTVAALLPPPAPVPATTLARSPSPEITLLESPHIKQEPVEIWSIPPVESASAALPPPSVSSMASHALQAPPVTAPPAIINIDAKPMPAYDCSFLTDPRVQGIGVKLQPLGKTLAVPHVFVRVHGERLMGKILIMTKNPTGATKLFHLNSVRYVVPTTRNQHVVRTAPGEDHGQIYFVMSYHGEVCVVRKHPKARGNGGRIQMPTRSLALVSIPRARPVKAEPVDD